MDKSKLTFIYRVTYAHMISYFLAGLFALFFMNYREHYASQYLVGYMRQISDPMVALGPGLQLFRGLILGLCLLPLKKLILHEQKGYLKLGGLILGLSSISTIGPAPGSFDGVIYTLLPLRYHLLGIPETLLYIVLLVTILAFSYTRESKIITWLSAASILIILLFSVLGYLSAKGLL